MGDSVLDGVMVPAAGRGGATEFPFYLCSIRRDDFALALNCVVSGIFVGLLGGETHGTPHPFIRAFARVDRAGPRPTRFG
jgi:hypothetical protein